MEDKVIIINKILAIDNEFKPSSLWRCSKAKLIRLLKMLEAKNND